MKLYHICILLIIYSSFAFAKPLSAFQPKKWLCVYHKIPVEKLLAAGVDLMVIDPDAYSAEQVAQLKGNGAKVVAYLSIGEAEGYRSYFPEIASSALIIKENPEWSDNFPVKYWEPQWFLILQKYTRQIVGKGFDGLFFDVVDAWEPYREKQALQKTRMEDLLISIIDLARALNPNLLMIIQNSHQLFEREELAGKVDGINQEGLYVSWLPDEMDQKWLAEKRQALFEIRKSGKFVTLLEYTRDPEKMAKIRLQASLRKFIPYFSVKELDRLFRD